MNNLPSIAKELAARPYVTIVLLDQTTDDEFMYVALNPEINGCMAQGDTVAEARRNLDETRIDFIRCLLEDGLVVPEPRLITARPIPASTQNLAALFDADSFVGLVYTLDAPPRADLIPPAIIIPAPHRATS